MAADTFKTTSGALAWDDPANWSTGALPGAGDDVTINAPASGSSTVTISATDPAYTVHSLSGTGSGANGMIDLLSVNGHLTVTGATTIASADLFVQNGGTVTLGTATLGAEGAIQVGGFGPNAAGTLSAGSITGSGILAEFLVLSGTASVTELGGDMDVIVYGGGSLTVNATSGDVGFVLSGGTVIDSTSAASLSDNLEIVRPSKLDLTSLPYQAGETVMLTPNTAELVQTYEATIRSATGATLFTLDNVQPGTTPTYVPVVNTFEDANGGTLVTLACYTPGTLIRTPDGEVAAGELRIGDLVTTLGGTAKPIVWIGRRSYGGRFLARQMHLLPIRFTAGSLGEGLPRRDLLVSPCHAMFLDGLLVPAGCLVDGQGICQERHADRVDYVHIELAEHDVIFAEGAPSETFVDHDSRQAFQNAAEYRALYGDDAGRVQKPYAPRVEDGYEIEAIRVKLAAFSERLGRVA